MKLDKFYEQRTIIGRISSDTWSTTHVWLHSIFSSTHEDLLFKAPKWRRRCYTAKRNPAVFDLSLQMEEKVHVVCFKGIDNSCILGMKKFNAPGFAGISSNVSLTIKLQKIAKQFLSHFRSYVICISRAAKLWQVGCNWGERRGSGVRKGYWQREG